LHTATIVLTSSPNVNSNLAVSVATAQNKKIGPQFIA
jgi:hypothetical protein